MKNKFDMELVYYHTHRLHKLLPKYVIDDLLSDILIYFDQTICNESENGSFIDGLREKIK